jgi:peptidoglycan/xylan/chitin deacetylase (PgdA/CDA1 family)
VNLDALAFGLLAVALAWVLWFLWGVVGGYARSGWWQAGRIAAAAAVALVVVGAASYWLMNSRTVQLLGDHVAHVDTDRKVVALTFDDGPSVLYASELVATLKRYDAHATFYVVGATAAAQPEALLTLIASGLEIGNHSYSHGRLVFVSTTTASKELTSTDAVIRATGFTRQITFRPPYAKKLLSLPWELWGGDRTTVMWDLEPDSPETIRGDPAAMTRYVMDNVRPGSIILLHPWAIANAATREALPAILAGLHQRGYEVVSASELLALR